MEARLTVFTVLVLVVSLGALSALAIVTATMWWVQIRIWLIPRDEIEHVAEGLRRTLGNEGARRAALENGLEACRQNDLVVQGLWDRVLIYLRKSEG